MRLVVLGERARVECFALAGAVVCPAESPEEVRRAWAALPGDVAVVVLTPAAADALPIPQAGEWPMTVVMPP